MKGGVDTVRDKELRKKSISAKERRRYLLVAGAGAALVLILALLLHGGGDRQRYERYRRQAAESYQNGQYDQALSELRKAEAIESSEDLLMLMADCYEAQENWDLALETLRRMDRNDPNVTERISALEQRRLQRK